MKLLILALTVSAVYASTLNVGFNFNHNKPHVGFNFKPQEKRQLYSSKLLHYVQMSGVFPDSKTFVDMHMKRDEKTILLAFDELLAKTQERPSKEQIAEFINYNFDSESELESWRPSDFVSEPSFLSSIKDAEFRQFARNVYNILPTLGRKIKPVVFRNPEQFSMIPVHNGFIVPGGKSKEFNYMESYWIIESLLISGMTETAKGMISNFIELQREFGYVPSGDRYYYLGRSQPPLLSAMMAIYIQETNDIEFLRANIAAIEGELEYWLDTHSVVFEVAGREHSLLRYITKCRGPRPEEYYQDFTNAQVFDNEQRQEQFYTDMKAAGESGWVLSSRWIMNKNGSNLGDLSWMHTTDIVPVDLNAIFANAVQNVAHFYSVLNDARRGAHWLEIRKRWMNSIKEVLWNEEEGMWFDWDLSSSQHRKYFYTSNLSPLWMGVVEPEFMKAKAQLIMNYLRKTHSLEFPGGVPASLVKSGYLYDLPYAYPAQVSIVVSALEALQTEESTKMAFEVAQNLVRSMYKAYQTNKQLYAKYDVEAPGKTLVAFGEYRNEEAFGGTIGVIIEMLAKFGATMTPARGYFQFGQFSSKYNQFYSTSAPQILNYQHSVFTAKPFVSVAKPESPIKPVYINDYKTPSVAPTYFAQTTYLPSEPTKPTFEEKLEATTLKEEEYISTTYQPEYTTSAPIKPYQPIYNKPSYTTFTPQKPTFVPEVKPQVIQTVIKPSYTQFTTAQPSLLEAKPEVAPTVYPVKPLYTSSKPQYYTTVIPTYIAPVKPVPTLPANNIKYELPTSKPSYVAPLPQKPEYVSVEAKPEAPLLEKKPEYLPVAPVPLKPEYVSVEAKPEAPLLEKKPEYLPVAPVPLKPEYVSVEAKPQAPLLEKKPEYLPVAPVPLKTEYVSVEAKPEAPLLEKKPEFLPVVPVPQKPEYLPVAPVPQKPEYLPVAPVPQKPEYLPVAPVPQKPEYLPVAPVPQKPEYLPIVPTPQKPYVSVQGKPEPQLLNKKPEYVSVVSSVVSKPGYVNVQAKPEVQAPEVKPIQTVHTESQFYTPAPVKPSYVIEAKPEVAASKPLYSKPVTTYVELKPESQLLEKKPEILVSQTEESISSTTLEPEYLSTTAQPELVTLQPAKPAQVTLYPPKPAYVSLYPAKPTFSSFPSWNKYTTPVKGQYVSAIKPLNIVQAKPEYSSTTEFQSEEYSTTLAPKYEATTTSKPEQLYPAKPAYVASLPIKHEYVSSVASLPAKEVIIQTSPVKPAYGQSYYVSSAKPIFAPTKPSLVSSVPVQAVSQQVSYTSSSYRQPSYVVPAISESKYPANAEYESSTIVEPEYTTLAAGEYTTYQPEYTTLAESEYPSTTLSSEFEYASTESQLVDATVKPQQQYGYFSAQSKPQAAAIAISGSASAEKKPFIAGYSTFSSQKQEGPKVETTYISSVQSQASGVAELGPVVSVSIPAQQQVQGQIVSQDQATIVKQAHFSFYDKSTPAPVVISTPAPVVISTLPPKTEGFSSFTQFNINTANSTKAESSSTVVASKPQYSGAFGYVFNKTVTPSVVTSTVNVASVPANQRWSSSGQYVAPSRWQGANWQGSSYTKPYSTGYTNKWSSYSQYQPQYQGSFHSQYNSGAYNSGAYNSGAYNSGLYKPLYSTTAKPQLSSTTAPSFAAILAPLAG